MLSSLLRFSQRESPHSGAASLQHVCRCKVMYREWQKSTVISLGVLPCSAEGKIQNSTSDKFFFLGPIEYTCQLSLTSAQQSRSITVWTDRCLDKHLTSFIISHLRRDDQQTYGVSARAGFNVPLDI